MKPENSGGGVPPIIQALVTLIDENFNEQTANFSVGSVTAASIAAAAGFDAGAVVLQRLERGGVKRIPADQPVELKRVGNAFYVLPGNATHAFTVDDAPAEWPRDQLSAAGILKLLAKSGEWDLVQREAESAEVLLDPEDIVTLSGGEKSFVTKPAKKTVTVYYGADETPFDLERRVYTTEELLTKFQVEDGYVLDVIFQKQFTALKPGGELKPKEGMKFTSHPPVGHSS